jgi:hypothetical protein
MLRMFLAKFSIRANVCSATEIAFTPTVSKTAIPLFLHSTKSMFSQPPKTPMNFNLLAESTSLSIISLIPAINPSYSFANFLSSVCPVFFQFC